jgi:hypothetical protein
LTAGNNLPVDTPPFTLNTTFNYNSRIKGEVANTNRIGMGIEFEEVSSNLQKKLGYLLYKII